MPALRRHGAVLAGLVLVVAGVLVWRLAPQDARGFGWYMYSPLDEQRYADYLHPRPFGPGGRGWDLLALALAGGGLALAAGGIGYRLGVRRGALGADGAASSGERSAG